MKLNVFVKSLTIVVLLFLLQRLSLSDISIHIEKGVDRPYPMALIPFSGDIKTKALPDGITGVIEKDLTNSGRFGFLTERKMPQKTSDANAIEVNKWRETGVEFIIVGNIKRASTGYDVSFYLISQLGGRSLIAQAFKNVSSSDLRALAHHISDLIYQGVTGVRGYFSTKLTYVEVLNPYNQEKAIYKLVVSDYDGFNPQVLLQQTGIPIATPTWSSNGHDIAYVSYIRGRMAIYKISVITGRRQLISNLEGINSAPAFGPNHQLALALSKGAGYYTNIFIFNLKTNKLKKLTSTGINTSPSFTPNGQSILFTSNRSGLPQIYQMRSNGSQPTRLTFNGIQNMDAQMTPNGKTIVYMHQQQRGGNLNIAKQDLSDGNMTILTDGNVDKSPSISPNGQMIVYTKGADSGNVNLAMVSLDGQVHLDLPATRGNVQSPAWSPYL